MAALTLKKRDALKRLLEGHMLVTDAVHLFEKPNATASLIVLTKSGDESVSVDLTRVFARFLLKEQKFAIEAELEKFDIEVQS